MPLRMITVPPRGADSVEGAGADGQQLAQAFAQIRAQLKIPETF